MNKQSAASCHRFCVLLMFWAGFSFVQGQNLILNPSFEEYLKCPEDLGTFAYDVKHWNSATAGSTDYFNSCSESMGIPKNFNGEQQPYNGQAYAGLYLIAPSDYREYLQVPFKYELEEDHVYELSFWLSLAESSDYAVRDFEILLNEREVLIDKKTNLLKGEIAKYKGNRIHSLQTRKPSFNLNRDQWFQIKFKFKAKGFEKFLIFGNLKTNRSTLKREAISWGTKRGSYYYIDDFSLVQLDPPPKDYKTEVLYTFEDVYFAFDSAFLNEKSRESVKRLKVFLDEHPNYKITIIGNTDSQGSDAYNQQLAFNRAKGIALYLENLGLGNNRLEVKSQGSQYPRATNESTEGRRLNRRVEFVLTQID